MTVKETVKTDEQAALVLSELYAKYGYKKYRMRNFEEYSMYLDNKDFLLSRNIITFNGANGKLLALRPDVTLSIVKNTNATKSDTEKMFYNENVFRFSETDNEYKEINQTGVEIIGNVNTVNTAEITLLALKSLEALDDNFVLEISHLGFVNAVLDEIGLTKRSLREKALALLANKNKHDFTALRESENLPLDSEKKFFALTDINGDFDSMLKKAEKIASSKEAVTALDELKSFYLAIKDSEYADKLRLNFSIINNSNYYTGIVFNGYIIESPASILVGGRYDGLLKKIGKKAEAIGFAINLSLLGNITAQKPIDYLLVYDSETPVKEVLVAADKLRKKGSVAIADKLSANYKYGKIVELKDGKLKETSNA